MTFKPAQGGAAAGRTDGRDGRAYGGAGRPAGPVDLIPGADDVTAAAVLAGLDRPVIGLSRWVAGAHAVAAGSGRTLYLVTGDGTRITYPLELLLTGSPAARWIVGSADGLLRDGLSGHPVHWDGQRFTGTSSAGAGGTGTTAAGGTDGNSADGNSADGNSADGNSADGHGADGPGSDAGAGSGGSDGETAPLLDGPGSVRLDITRVDPVTASAEIGGTASAAITALTGAAPSGWGAGEPVSEPWSPRQLTAFARDRAPLPTSVVVTAGSEAAGLFEAEPVASGVHTRLRLALGAAGPPGPGFLASLDALAETLAAEDAHAMLVAWQPGRADATREAGPQQPGVPVGLFAGHEIVSARGVEHARAAPAEATAIVGSGSRQACWCRFGTERPHQVLVEVMNHFRQW